LLVAAAFAVASYNPSWPIDEVHAMTNKQEQVARLLHLPPADYFSFGEDRQIKLQAALTDLVLDGNADSTPPARPILALGAPERINLDQQKSAPVLLAHVQSGLHAWQVNFTTNLHLFVRNLSTGELAVAEPLVNVRRGQLPLLSGGGDPPSTTIARTLNASVRLLDLREKFGGALAPGHFVVTAVANDVRSNSVQIGIESSAAPRKPQAQAAQPYVRFKLESRPLMDTRVDVPKAVSGSGAIAVRVAMQVNAGVLKTQSGEFYWPSHVVLVKLDENPQIIPALVPVQSVGAPGGRPAFNAVFEVDVRAAAKSPLVGWYQVYLDTGRELLGPYAFEATK
jgi:hypothetical protein